MQSPARVSCALAVGGVALLALLASTAHAQVLDDPRAVGMSGVRGDPLANSAVYHNPAGMSRAHIYAAEVLFLRDGANQNVAGVNVVDSKTQQSLAVGVSYGYQFTDEDAPIRTGGHDVRLALAHAFTQRVHVGVGVRYLHLDREADEGIVVEDLKGFTLDAGMLIDFGSGLHVGAYGENLVAVDDPTVPRRAGGAVGYATERFTIDVDVLGDFDRHPEGDAAVMVQSGLEVLVDDQLPIRVGYTWDGALEESWVGGGLGFITHTGGTQGGQISVSYRQNVTRTDDYQFAAGFTLFL